MVQISKHPVAPRVDERIYEIFIDSIKNVRYKPDVISFLNDLLSPTERIMLAKRVTTAFLLIKGKYTYDQISKILRVSKGTIAKIHAILAVQGEGYRKIIIQMLKKQAIKQVLSELVEVITPIPPKGANWSEWYRERRKAKLKRQEPL